MHKVFRWTLLFVVLMIFTSGAVAVYTVFFSSPEENVATPLLREMSVIEAVPEAERLGFVVQVEQVVSSLPEGRVLAQSPEAGLRVRKGRTLLLRVSRGGARRTVPDVRKLAVARAQTLIQEQGFEVGDVIYIKDNASPVGTVIAQSPAAPANIPSDKKIHLLVNQPGPGSDGKVPVPDVAQMSERQARELLAASGLKIATVDPVYSPNATEGLVISTRPAAGESARVGDSVRLKIATARRPQGVPEPPATAPTTVPGASSQVQVQENSRPQVVVTVPGHGEIFVGEGFDPKAPATPMQAVDSNISVFDQRSSNRTSAVVRAPQLPASTPQPAASPLPAPATRTAPAGNSGTQARTPQPANLLPVGGKLARIRYQVPPLSRPLQLKIELVDPSGTKVLVNRQAKSGEYLSLDAPYSKECTVTIYLGGDFVWQDRYM
ncbi:MAG: PASTA domain-containing protein [Synergistaceae bacterium]|jgi:serine/threonine-protein kinase|nr:PASTA domain-containing protein [Synergistaceae bacterium]